MCHLSVSLRLLFCPWNEQWKQPIMFLWSSPGVQLLGKCSNLGNFQFILIFVCELQTRILKVSLALTFLSNSESIFRFARPFPPKKYLWWIGPVSEVQSLATPVYARHCSRYWGYRGAHNTVSRSSASSSVYCLIDTISNSDLLDNYWNTAHFYLTAYLFS